MEADKKNRLAALNNEIHNLEVQLGAKERERRLLRREMVQGLPQMKGVSRPTDLSFGTWDCPTSPTGNCVYNHPADPSHDECLFCHEPHDRP